MHGKVKWLRTLLMIVMCCRFNRVNFLCLLVFIVISSVMSETTPLLTESEILRQANELKFIYKHDMMKSMEGLYSCSNRLCHLSFSNATAMNARLRVLPYYISDISPTENFPSIRSINNILSTSTIQPQMEMIDQQMIYRYGQAKTLVVLTTCNQLKMTKQAVDYLRESLNNNYHVVIIDDHSIDGTPHYLSKRGYHVISKPTAKGLTDSWNVAYKFARTIGYDYIIYLNNDVLVPRGALDIMLEVLKDHPVVVPTTTHLGAGHNPNQVTNFMIKFLIAFLRHS
jgi:hypothetical protein